MEDLGLIIFVAYFAFVAWTNIAADRKWGQFEKEHRCVVIGKERNRLLPDKTVYLCDDGIEYVR